MYNLYERRKTSGIAVAHDKLFVMIFLSGVLFGIVLHLGIQGKL